MAYTIGELNKVNQILTENQPRILCVDDEIEVLESLERVLRRAGYRVDVQCSPIEALRNIVDKQYDIIISDMRMPEMNGASFLEESQKLSPSSMRILLTGYSDQESTVKAINEGKIFSYIKKPWDNSEFREVVASALKQKQDNDQPNKILKLEKQISKALMRSYSSLTNEVTEANACLRETSSILEITKTELQNSHQQTVKVFSQLLALKCGQKIEAKAMMVEHSRFICDAVGFRKTIKHDLENAIFLFDLGKLTLSEELRSKNSDELTKGEKIIFNSHPLRATELLLPLTYMQGVGEILSNCYENYDGSGYPNNKSGTSIPIASRMLKIIVAFSEKLNAPSGSIQVARDFITQNIGSLYDPELAQIYLSTCAIDPSVQEQLKQKIISVEKLDISQTVCKDLVGINGMLLLAKGTQVTNRIIKVLSDYELNRTTKLCIAVSEYVLSRKLLDGLERQ